MITYTTAATYPSVKGSCEPP